MRTRETREDGESAPHGRARRRCVEHFHPAAHSVVATAPTHPSAPGRPAPLLQRTPAIALASIVFPQPGGPCSRMPLGWGFPAARTAHSAIHMASVARRRLTLAARAKGAGERGHEPRWLDAEVHVDLWMGQRILDQFAYVLYMPPPDHRRRIRPKTRSTPSASAPRSDNHETSEGRRERKEASVQHAHCTSAGARTCKQASMPPRSFKRMVGRAAKADLADVGGMAGPPSRAAVAAARSARTLLLPAA